MSLDLFSLPHAGGGATAFHSWRHNAGRAIIHPVLWGDELALLGDASSFETLAAVLGRRLERAITGDFALIGASAGGRLALALADWLCRREAGVHLKLAVVLSMPTLQALPRLDQLVALDDPGLFSALQQLGGVPPELVLDAKLFRAGLARTRRELRLFRGQALPTRRGNYPLHFCAGHLDQLVDNAELAALSSTLAAECTLWPGDHFFWQESTALPRFICELSQGRGQR